VKVSSAQIVRSWAWAGFRFGALLGAVLGGLIAAAAIPILAVIGAPVGAVIGSLYGLAVGTLDGLVLALLNRFGPAAALSETNGGLNAITAAATTSLAGYLLQNAVFGTVGGRGARFVVIGLPVIAEAAAAIWLSHRLPPADPRSNEARPGRVGSAVSHGRCLHLPMPHQEKHAAEQDSNRHDLGCP
jgi:hypothetical protein